MHELNKLSFLFFDLGILEDDPLTKTLFDKVYENFIEEVDAVDNGINVCEGKPRYE